MVRIDPERSEGSLAKEVLRYAQDQIRASTDVPSVGTHLTSVASLPRNDRHPESVHFPTSECEKSHALYFFQRSILSDEH